jgi:hypothetical protein
MQFAFAGYWNAVLFGRGVLPLLDDGDDRFIDWRAEAFEQGQFRDFAMFVDDSVQDDVSLGAVWEAG